MAKRPVPDAVPEEPPAKVSRFGSAAVVNEVVTPIKPSRFGSAPAEEPSVDEASLSNSTVEQPPIKKLRESGTKAGTPNEHHAILTAAHMRRPFMEKLKDVTVKVDDLSFLCHKLVLCAASPAFEQRLTGRLLKAKKEKDVLYFRNTPECWKAVEDFIYWGDTTLASVDFALQLVVSAIEFELGDLVREITNYLLRHMDDDNVYRILHRAHDLKLKELATAAKYRVITSGELMRIADVPIFYDKYFWQLVEQMLAAPDARVRSELDVFAVARTWLTKGGTGVVEERRRHVDTLLVHVDLRKLNNHELGRLHRDALQLGIPEYAAKVQDKLLDGTCAHLPAIAPEYRLPYPRRNKTLSFTYRLSGVSVLGELYEGSGKDMCGNWHRDELGNFWRVAVSVEDVENHKFLGVFLNFRAPHKPQDAQTTVTFQCFVVKNEKYEAVNVRERATAFDKSDDKCRQGWKEFLAFDKLSGDHGYADGADSVTFGATIYFGQ